MAVNPKDVADLSAWIDSLAPAVKVKPLLQEPPEEADALVIIATKVRCMTCEAEHISSSHVMKRVPRPNGNVIYKPVSYSCVGLPHVVEWAFEQVSNCWKCFDLAERLLNPEANLALAPERVEFEPAVVDNRPAVQERK